MLLNKDVIFVMYNKKQRTNKEEFVEHIITVSATVGVYKGSRDWQQFSKLE